MAARRMSFLDADDSGWTAHSRSGLEAELDITPLIDVTFLLLIFFMVTSTMQATPDLDVPAARYGMSVGKPDSTIISLLTDGAAGTPPRIIVGDGSGPEISLEEVSDRVRTGLLEDKKSQVIIKADRDTPFRYVREVTSAVMEVEGVKYHIGVQDDQAGGR